MQNKPIIWRNDDVSYKTAVNQFDEVHKLFKEHITLHTIALICKDIEKNKPLIDYINTNNIEVQVHCWEHYDFTLEHEKLKIDLPKCVKAITKHFKHAPVTLFPPWNKTDATVEAIAKENGLSVSHKKVSLSQYIRFEGKVGEDVINFHSWAYSDIIVLEEALKLYSSLRK